MINIEVFSEEKAWSKKLRKKELFFKKICKLFPRKYQFPNKEISLTLLLSNNRFIKKLNKESDEYLDGLIRNSLFWGLIFSMVMILLSTIIFYIGTQIVIYWKKKIY